MSLKEHLAAEIQVFGIFTWDDVSAHVWQTEGLSYDFHV